MAALTGTKPVLDIKDHAGDAAWWLYECRRNERAHAGRGLYREADAWAAAARSGLIGVPPAAHNFMAQPNAAATAPRRRQRNPMYTNAGSHAPCSGLHSYAEITRIVAGDQDAASTGYYGVVENIACDITDDLLRKRREAKEAAEKAAADAAAKSFYWR
jgi:hypothetical protein